MDAFKRNHVDRFSAAVVAEETLPGTRLEVTIVSSHGLLRHSLQKLVEPFCSRVLCYQSIDQARHSASHGAPNSVLIVEPLAGQPITQQIADIAQRFPGWQLVLLLKAMSEVEMGTSIRAGARGCITHETPPERIVGILELVSNGHIVWPAPLESTASFSRRLTDKLACDQQRRPPDFHERLGLLSRREVEVLNNVGDGLGNKRIGNVMNISDTTVRLHMRSIMRKIGAENRTQVALFAVLARAENS